MIFLTDPFALLYCFGMTEDEKKNNMKRLQIRRYTEALRVMDDCALEEMDAGKVISSEEYQIRRSNRKFLQETRARLEEEVEQFSGKK